MNEVQKVVFDLFKNFIRICDELELRYYLVNGTALGAIKYRGFIPWDDDMDVAMPRKDYEIFLSKAQKFLPENVFLQNYRTDSKFPLMYSKLRNSDTTFIESSVSNIKMNHGIYLDIFPLDSCNEKQISSKFRNRIIKIMFWFPFCALDDRSKKKVILRNNILKKFGFDKKTDKYLGYLENYVSSDDENRDYLCNYSDRQGKGCIPKEWYGCGYSVVFEGIKAVIPEKYDDYLTNKYNNWRSDLRDEEKKSHHKALTVDTDKSYIEYINH